MYYIHTILKFSDEKKKKRMEKRLSKGKHTGFELVSLG